MTRPADQFCRVAIPEDPHGGGIEKRHPAGRIDYVERISHCRDSAEQGLGVLRQLWMPGHASLSPGQLPA
jgi:hypothetical protein